MHGKANDNFIFLDFLVSFLEKNQLLDLILAVFRRFFLAKPLPFGINFLS